MTTVRRLFREAGLTRGVRPDGHTRLRRQADHAGALWHGDVCHGPALRIGKTTKPLRVHALLDDTSRDVVALKARARIRYASSRSNRLQVGSGPTEGVCKSVIAMRFKRSGQRWFETGLAPCLSLRALHLSERLRACFDQAFAARQN